MPLSREQIQQIVKDKPLKKYIQKGINHQQRLRFHTQTILSKPDLGAAYNDWCDWIGSETPKLLAADKFERIKQLVRTPIQTIELTEQIFTKLSTIFSSQDKFFKYSFTDKKYLDDWDTYRNQTFWKVHGFEAMQTAIDSFWVVDFPEKQTGELPEPKNKLIDISSVVYTEIDQDNVCHYLIYIEGNQVREIDKDIINIYEIDKNNKLSATPISFFKHVLGYCPAKMFWTQKLEASNNINKESPLSKSLTDLDWLLFHLTAKKYLDLANAYPILAHYEADNDYKDSRITENQGGQKSPEANVFIGPGTSLKIPVPRSVEEIDQMGNPVKYINPDTETLTWHVNEEKRLLSKIYHSVVGIDQISLNDVAKNEDQIESTYESQVTVLNRIKSNFEIINEFADKVICQLRYGDKFKGIKIDYGTKFFLKSIDDLHEDYKQAKESGASDVILESITNSILNTAFREDTDGKTRAEIIRDLDPLPEKTIDESIKIFEKGGIDKINFVIKANLLSFVKRFEREKISLVEFMRGKEYSKKIDIINQKFIKYANERRTETAV